MSSPDPRTPEEPWSSQQSYGHPYGKAPTGGNTLLGRVYTFLGVWMTTALIMFFGGRMLGFGRGDVGYAVIALVVSLVAALGIVAWLRRRGR